MVSLITNAKATTGQRVNIYAASNGAMTVLSFFNYLNTTSGLGITWIQDNLCGFFTDSGVWAGAPAMIPALSNGLIDRADIQPNLVREMEITWSDSYWNLPRPPSYDASQVLITVANPHEGKPSTYTALDLGEFILDVFGGSINQPFATYNRVANMSAPSLANQPPLPTSMYYGFGFLTTPVSQRKE